MKKKELTDQINNLSSFELIVLFILAYYPNSTKSKLVGHLNSLSFKVVSTRNIYPKDVDPVLEKLVADGLVFQKKSNSYSENLVFSIEKKIKREVIWKLKDSAILKQFTEFVANASTSSYSYMSEDFEYRLILSMLLNNELKFENYCRSDPSSLGSIFIQLFDNPLTPGRLNELKPSIRNIILPKLYEQITLEYRCLNPFIDYLESLKNADLNLFLALAFTVTGNQQKLKSQENILIDAIYYFLSGKNETALQFFNKNTENYRKAIGKKNAFIIGFNTSFHLLALLKQNDEISNNAYDTLLSEALKQKKGAASIFDLFRIIRLFRQNNIAAAKQFLKNLLDPKTYVWDWLLIWALIKHWFDKFDATEITFLQFRLQQCIENEYWLLAINLFDILKDQKKLNPENSETLINAIRTKTGIVSLAQLFEKEDDWERALKALTMLSTKTTKTINDKRLSWFIDFDHKSIQPKEQSMSKNGLWSDGKNVALKRLQKNELDSMTTQDIKIASNIKKTSYGYYGSDDYFFDHDKCFKEMVGHPLLFLDQHPPISVELVKAQPELIIEKSGSKFEISFNEKFAERGLKIVKETPTRYKLFEITEDLITIQTSLGKRKLVIPESGKEKLLNAIKSISSLVTVHSDLGQDSSIPSIEANSQPHIHLLTFNSGFKIEFFVKPFTTTPPYFKPGSGGKVLYTMIDGRKVQAIRNLQKEEELTLDFINACPSLADMDDFKGSWVFNDPDECLQFLIELEDVKDKIIVEWPEGEKLRIKHHLSFKNLSLNIKSSGTEWFSVGGEIKVSDRQVMDMKELLTLIEQHKTNYIPLGNGDFISLTKEFRRRLEEMSAFADHSKGEFKFNAISAFALSDLFDDLEIKADKQWKDTIKNIKTTLKLKAEIPANLDAELRPYQVDGYNWLFRLSHWGVGACLADDMGLGKTLQSIALLLERAENGPALVLAPASVCGNWIKEFLKFAPSLNPVFYADQRDVLERLSPSLIVVCTYGLMQSNIEAFTAVNWNTVILDEAQAIKNNATKRSQAVMELKSGFRLVTTGTPIQNHLGELWSLFNFINPGLLGSLKMFNERFAIPIEKNQDKIKRHQLKRLIQPFILRRTKNQVLDELPEKTEITINVELSTEEMAFYEALRLQAIEKLQSDEGNIEQKRIQILAEITKLRRACCNPSLVMPEIELESSKLAAFEEIVDELIENKHRALVFSQFLGHLDIVSKLLEKKNISYQYLDGGTPLKDREKSISAFQSGAGDLFLISLKAGGLGLNLTAADYVIHMDPWWNPAIEDQASDRAHRIGQTRPVTIYKLITQNTIEEKIIKLHQNKRALADSLLDGSDMSGKVSADELLNLIRY